MPISDPQVDGIARDAIASANESFTVSRTASSLPDYPAPDSSGIKFPPIQIAIACLLIAGAAWSIYGETARHAFVNFDDLQYVADNPHVTSGLTWNGAKWAFTTGYFYNWHPVTWLSHMLDTSLFGLRAAGHHLTSATLHAANALLLFGLLLSATGMPWRSAIVAALFAVHPINVESVAWIAERKTVLCALFGFLTTWAYIRYTRKPGWRSYSSVVLLFALGLMAKPMLVTLPFQLMLLDVWPLGRYSIRRASADESPESGGVSAWQLLREKLPLLAMSAASSTITYTVQMREGAVMDSSWMPYGHRMANALFSYFAYLGKLFWPVDLALFYPHRAFSPTTVAACALALVAITASAIALARRRPYILVGWLWFLGSLVPVIGLVQVGEQAMADRYAYLPMIGIAIAVVWTGGDVFARYPRSRLALASFAGLALVLLILVSQTQVRYWNNSVVLWTRSLKINPNSCIAHANLGSAFGSRGRYAEALSELNKSIEICPDFAEARGTLGSVLTLTGRLEEARTQFVRVVREKPELLSARNGLAKVLAQQGQTRDAINEYREVLRRDPADKTALAAMKAMNTSSAPSSPPGGKRTD